MGKSLVIVESPARAKTINKYLGKDFIVKSSVGHIRDLPTSGGATSDPKARAKAAALTRKMSPDEKAVYKKKKAKDQLVNRMGIDPENNWAAKYQVLPGKEKVVNELKRLAADADHIYLATDLDREGEAIAWHLKESIGGDDSRYSRVVFNEITKNAITEAFEHPSELDVDRVNAQQARRFLDRVVGFMVSPLLWAKVARGLSAGRVQSVAAKLVVEREREIRAFIPEEYWEVKADCESTQREQFKLEVKKHAGQAFKPTNEADTLKAVAEIEAETLTVSKREDKAGKTKPGAPFITSTMQQAASTRLGFGVKKTMMMAQRLYEAGYITYMRTDSTNLSKEAVESCREYVRETLNDRYLPPAAMVYSSKDGAQEAHEAIRPSEVRRRADNLEGMEKDAVRLYELIWRQFVACQMAPMEYLGTTISVAAGDYELRTRGRIIQFEGFTRIQPQQSKKEDEVSLPEINPGDVIQLKQLLPTQHFTKPPARFSEAALVKELEKRGIGRPSTYASIISTIQDRGYVTVNNRRFYAEKMGDIVTDRLSENFEDLMDYSFTANMEVSLDDVAEGNRNWLELLNEFYANFTKQLEAADDADSGMRANDPTETNIACPTCSRMMQVRTGTTGVFLGCSGYALPPKERCKTTINLVPEVDVVSADEDAEIRETKELQAKHRCSKCGTAMDGYLIDEHRKLHVCGNNPDCNGFEIEEGSFKIKGYDGPVLDCDKCGAEMQLKTGRFGKYFGCTSDTCKNTRKLLRSGQAAPPKMDPVPMPELQCVKVDDTYILRDGASGLFLAASQFPKNRETRAPLLAELVPHQDEIDPKYSYLFSGPVKDSSGRKSIIRYSRKTQENYLMTEDKDGKATGWKAYYRDGDWKIEAAKPKKKAAPKAKPKTKKS